MNWERSILLFSGQFYIELVLLCCNCLVEFISKAIYTYSLSLSPPTPVCARVCVCVCVRAHARPRVCAGSVHGKAFLGLIKRSAREGGLKS